MMFRHLSKLIKISFTVLILLLFSSCKDRNKRNIPFVSVDIEVNVYSNLNSLGIGQSAYINPSSDGRAVLLIGQNFETAQYLYTNQFFVGNGLILYRESDDIFYVFDRTCTYEPEQNCAVTIKNASDNIPECPCCGSRYVIVNGTCSPLAGGKAPYALTRYQAFITAGILYIKN